MDARLVEGGQQPQEVVLAHLGGTPLQEAMPLQHLQHLDTGRGWGREGGKDNAAVLERQGGCACEGLKGAAAGHGVHLRQPACSSMAQSIAPRACSLKPSLALPRRRRALPAPPPAAAASASSSSDISSSLPPSAAAAAASTIAGRHAAAKTSSMRRGWHMLWILRTRGAPAQPPNHPTAAKHWARTRNR